MYMGTAPPQCGGRALTLKRRVGETSTPATSSTADINEPYLGRGDPRTCRRWLNRRGGSTLESESTRLRGSLNQPAGRWPAGRRPAGRRPASQEILTRAQSDSDHLKEHHQPASQPARTLLTGVRPSGLPFRQGEFMYKITVVAGCPAPLLDNWSSPLEKTGADTITADTRTCLLGLVRV